MYVLTPAFLILHVAINREQEESTHQTPEYVLESSTSDLDDSNLRFFDSETVFPGHISMNDLLMGLAALIFGYIVYIFVRTQKPGLIRASANRPAEPSEEAHRNNLSSRVVRTSSDHLPAIASLPDLPQELVNCPHDEQKELHSALLSVAIPSSPTNSLLVRSKSESAASSTSSQLHNSTALDQVMAQLPPNSPVRAVVAKINLTLSTPLNPDMPATELRSKLKSLAAELKLASFQEAPVHITEHLAPMIGWCMTIMSAAYIITLVLMLTDNMGLSSFDFNSFLPTSFDKPSSLSYLKILFAPFTLNWITLLPYFVAYCIVSTVVTPIPIVGPWISRLLNLAFAIAFFRRLLPSFICILICDFLAIGTAAYITIRKKWPRWWTRLLCVSLSVLLGIVIASTDPMLRYAQNPLLVLGQKIGLGDFY
jgi:hypothetical protein